MNKSGRIKEQWESYRKRVIPRNASSTQVTESRRAFYAGVEAMMSVNLAITDLPDDGAVTELEMVTEELNQFVSDVKAGRA